MADSDKLFSTQIAGVNYQKIALKGSGSVNVVSHSGSPPGTFTDVTIPHPVGVPTFARVWYDPELGQRFPATWPQFFDDDTSTTMLNDVMLNIRLTSSDLILRFLNFSASTKATNYWYRVYYDVS